MTDQTSKSNKSAAEAGLPSYSKLPGFTLPLNHSQPTVDFIDVDVQSSDGPVLFPTALDSGKLNDGYCSCVATFLREQLLTMSIAYLC